MAQEYAIELKGITKTFGSVVANNNVQLNVRPGEILALLGENGSGKTTLMNMLSGIYKPDKGQIFVEGKEVSINSPEDSKRLGIGMVHQHFKLVDVFSAADNIWMGREKSGLVLKKNRYEEIENIAQKFGFEIDPRKKVYNMSVSEKQTVEIIKVLYRGADILILDEPTANLDIRHQVKVIELLHDMAHEKGMTVIMISHDLNVAARYADKIIVMSTPGVVYDVGEPHEVITKEMIRYVYGMNCTVVDNEGRPHIILGSALSDEEVYELHRSEINH